MITLITGQPGAGKTLYTIYLIDQLSRLENRQVYYSGIADLALPWSELEKVDDWVNCPGGSIIVIDECQRAFRPRGNGSHVPESVSAMETHRHRGLDLFLVTQHPMLLDSNIRRLVGRHLHVVRAFGSAACNVHEWGEVREGCDKNRSGSVRKFWKYQKEIYRYYKSADQHTTKFRPPVRLLVLVLMPFLLIGIIFFLVGWFGDKQKPKEVPASVKTEKSSVPSANPNRQVVLDKPGYLSALTPRVTGFAHTASYYDDVTKPVDAPYPVACVVGGTGSSCKCYDQTGTILPTPLETCRSLVKTGFFKAWERARK